MQSKKNRKENTAGFTIIELVLVVGIIAALTSIVLNNVTGYIVKAKDVAIKASMGAILVNASTYFEINSGYGGFCNDVITENIYDSINSFNKNCKASANRWVVCAKLNIPPDGSKAWCSDSTGIKEEINDSLCTNSLNICP